MDKHINEITDQYKKKEEVKAHIDKFEEDDLKKVGDNYKTLIKFEKLFGNTQ